MMKNIYSKILVLIASFVAISCGDDEFPVPEASEIDVKFDVNITGDGFAPSAIQFSNQTYVIEGISAVSYAWNFGDGTSSTEENPSHTYTLPGTYKVTLTAYSDNDLDFAETTVTVRDPNALLVRLFFIDAGTSSINEIDGGTIDVGGFGTGIAYDPVVEKIYYTNADDLTLMRMNLDGSAAETVSDVFSDPRDVALDVDNNMAYVTDRGSDVQGVWSIDLTDGSATLLYDNASSGLGELPVGIDYHDGNLYITCVEIDAEAVWVGNVDGSGVTRIIDFNAGGYGYGIAVDKANEKIYFDDTQNGKILQANLDGTGVTEILDTGNRAYGIAIDNTNGKIYWSERGTGSIYMANLDGSNIITLTSDYDDPRGLFFIE